jgi:hypothetical protein
MLVRSENLLNKSENLDTLLNQLDNMSEILAKKYLEETIKSNLDYIKNMQMISEYTKIFLTSYLCRSLSDLKNYHPKENYRMRGISIDKATKKVKMLSKFYKVLDRLG